MGMKLVRLGMHHAPEVAQQLARMNRSVRGRFAPDHRGEVAVNRRLKSRRRVVAARLVGGERSQKFRRHRGRMARGNNRAVAARKNARYEFLLGAAPRFRLRDRRPAGANGCEFLGATFRRRRTCSIHECSLAGQNVTVVTRVTGVTNYFMCLKR